MNMRSHFSRTCQAPILRSAALLVMLAWSRVAYCGEIHDAARDGDLVMVQSLLKGNPTLAFSTDTNGATPMHWAASMGHNDVVELLLANKAEVNVKEDAGRTPLHLAAFKGHQRRGAIATGEQSRGQCRGQRRPDAITPGVVQWPPRRDAIAAGKLRPGECEELQRPDTIASGSEWGFQGGGGVVAGRQGGG